MIDRNLLLNIVDQESLAAFLAAPENLGGLGWPLAVEDPFQFEPEIAAGVKGDGLVTVSRLIGDSADQYLVLLAEFERPYVRRDLRDLLSSVRRHIRATGRFEDHTELGDTLFIVAAPGYEDVRFVLFEERDRRLPRIRSFGWRREFVGRTVLTHNLGRLLWSQGAHWETAWDVEGLTDAFYTEFVQVFNSVKAATNHPGGAEKRHAYVQQMLNRLLFIAFVERMGWLRLQFHGPFPPGAPGFGPGEWQESDYLFCLWKRHIALKEAGWSYQDLGLPTHLAPLSFHSLLRNLFFKGLDAPEGIAGRHALYALLGDVPYLNGGLFSEEEDLDHAGVTVGDEVFDLLLGDRRPGFDGGLFRRFNFTVTESTPLDQEVAVDPEMLGKIFERIIIAEERHRTGTYYTPRPIVEFMVNEALQGYLTERGLAADKAAMLVDEDTLESEALSFRASEMQDTLEWLFEVRAVDPACGSGAYLLMLLQRLFELADRLEVVRNKRRDPDQKHLYNTKLRLLERCVYGVDMSEVAVRIARLRLWLSLVVENRGEKPEPLPNFDFLIMCGDSLASPLFPAQGVLGYPRDAIREYTRLKGRYFHPESGRPRPTREQMRTKRAEIAEAFDDALSNSRLRALSKNPFDWEIEFAEVFDPPESEETLGGRLNLGTATGRGGQAEFAARAARTAGFDIVLANPPYVREQLISLDKTGLRERFPRFFHGKADLFTYFFGLASELLGDGGQLAFITPNRWLQTDYAEPLRRELQARFGLKYILNFDDLPVFQGQVTYSLITIATKGRPSSSRYLRLPSFSADTEFARLAERESVDIVLPVNGEPWRASTSTLCPGTRTLGDVTGGGPYLGLKTGYNDPFYIDQQLAATLFNSDPSLAGIIRPLVRGQDTNKWVGFTEGSFVLWTHDLASLDAYPVLVQHFGPFLARLEVRQNRGTEYWQFRPSRLYGLFDGPKIVFPDIVAHAKFALVRAPAVIDTTAFFIPSDDLFLLAVLNSKPAEELFEGMGVKMRGGFFRFNKSYSQNIPIPLVGDDDRHIIEGLVQRIFDRKAADASSNVLDIEAEIDRRVEFLYFHAEEAPTYDEWTAKTEAERGTAIGLVRSLIDAGESGNVEFKQSLEYVDPSGFANVPEAQRGQRISESQKAVVHSALETICAFLNSRGGTLLLGVHDNGGIIGIEPDYTLLGRKPNRDRFELKLTDLLRTRIRPIPTSLDVRFVEIDGKTVCRIDAPADPRAHYLDNKLYVRIGNSTEELTGRDLEDWLRGRT